MFLRIFPYKGLPVPVYVLFFSRIVNRMGDFVRFFLTLYLTGFLGMDEKSAGFIITLSGLASMAGNIAGGKLTDHAGRKKVMLGAQVCSAAFIGFCGFIPDSALLPWLLIVSQFFCGAVRPVSSSMVMDLTVAEQRQKAISLLYLGINIGVAVGPLIAGFLFNNFRRWIFWGDAATTIIAVLLVAFLVPESMPAAGNDESLPEQERHEEGSVFKVLLKRPVLAIFLASSVLMAFIYSQASFTLPLQCSKVFPGDGARIFGILMSANAVTVLVLTPVVLKIFGNRKPLSNLVTGSLCFAWGFGMLYRMDAGISWYLLSTVIWTIGEIIMVTNEGVFTAAHSPVNHRGRINGIRNMMHSAGSAATPLLSGIFISAVSLRAVWPLIIILCLVYLAVIAYLNHRDS